MDEQTDTDSHTDIHTTQYNRWDKPWFSQIAKKTYRHTDVEQPNDRQINRDIQKKTTIQRLQDTNTKKN